eukprot:scaffold881_cov65-Phaeocystis_antarctica.AAC.7
MASWTACGRSATRSTTARYRRRPDSRPFSSCWRVVRIADLVPQRGPTRRRCRGCVQGCDRRQVLVERQVLGGGGIAVAWLAGAVGCGRGGLQAGS